MISSSDNLGIAEVFLVLEDDDKTDSIDDISDIISVICIVPDAL